MVKIIEGSVIFGTPTYSPDRWHSSQIYDNGVAGIHIVDTTDFTFEATFNRFLEEGDGYVGSVDGQQPIEVIVESSQRVTFQDMDVRSANGENIFSESIEIAHKAQSIPNRGEHKNILNVQNQGPVVFERRSMYPALAYG